MIPDPLLCVLFHPFKLCLNFHRKLTPSDHSTDALRNDCFSAIADKWRALLNDNIGVYFRQSRCKAPTVSGRFSIRHKILCNSHIFFFVGLPVIFIIAKAPSVLCLRPTGAGIFPGKRLHQVDACKTG